MDIGTGTGLLSLMMAQQCAVLIDAIEIDPSAAEQASANIAASPWKERIRVIQSDIKDFAAGHAAQYDIVICNPPFYENELTSTNPAKNVARHAEGLLLREVLQVIRQSVCRDGHFFLLLPFKRMAEAQTLFDRSGLLVTDTVLVRQSAKHGFFRVMLAGTTNDNDGEKKQTKTEMSVWNERQQYTPQFIHLLKDYYLYL
jgi:tRNA1Val (adenine37-N6)-methyltransferase